jgi:hypothetical protein
MSRRPIKAMAKWVAIAFGVAYIGIVVACDALTDRCDRVSK